MELKGIFNRLKGWFFYTFINIFDILVAKSLKPNGLAASYMSDTIRKPLPEITQAPEMPQEMESGERIIPERPNPSEQKDEAILPPSLPTPVAVSDDDRLHLVEEDKSQLLKDIERVLEEDLELLYTSLNQKQRKQFRDEGEKMAGKIEVLMQKTKITIMEIIKLIKKWLSLLPGANRYFLEKEAKIKAEKILSLRSEVEDW